MAHRITLIITKEVININSKIPHFYENGYLVIPFGDNGCEISQIEELSESYQSFDEVFKQYLIDFWKDDDDDDILGASSEIADYKSLLLVELVKRLRLSDFLLYHYQEIALETYSYAVNFIDRTVSGSGYEEFEKTGIETTNYWRYDSCERRYFTQMTKEKEPAINNGSTKKWFEFWK